MRRFRQRVPRETDSSALRPTILSLEGDALAGDMLGF